MVVLASGPLPRGYRSEDTRDVILHPTGEHIRRHLLEVGDGRRRFALRHTGAPGRTYAGDDPVIIHSFRILPPGEAVPR